jgi:23S rRNA pseudouridine1911/1915/1917 synthase
MGCPVAGDKQYGAKSNPLGRLCLHAGELAFRHPATGESMRFVAKAPKEFYRIFR